MSFAFVDIMTGVVKYDGLILLSMIIKISKPYKVTDICDIELGLDVNDVNKCIYHQQQICVTPTHTALATFPNSEPPLFFDTDGISFIIESSATCIICNQRDLFIGRLSSEQVSMTTCEEDTAKQIYLGTMQLILKDESNIDQ